MPRNMYNLVFSMSANISGLSYKQNSQNNVAYSHLYSKKNLNIIYANYILYLIWPGI